MNQSYARTAMTYAMRILHFLPFALAIAVLPALVAVPNSAHAQSVPVTKIENAAGDSVLTVFEDGGFAVYGEEFTGTIPSTGDGTRLMWYPAKAALRAGEVDGSAWDDANIGSRSVAFGSETEASGDVSVAMGFFTIASGKESTALGNQTTASGEHAIAMGFGTTASGDESVAMGDNTEATAVNATAMGSATVASESNSTAMGWETTASGVFSTAMGERTEAVGKWSTAMGDNTIAETEQSLSIGTYNDANTSADNTLFVVGNGTYTIDGADRSDALVLHRNGDLTISGGLTQSSDRRLKERIQPLGTGMLDKLEDIRPVRFHFKNERTHPSDEQIGLVAQEVQAQFPQLVSEGASGYLSVSYSKFTAVLLKGLQEQQAQLQKQQEQIERLRGQQEQIAALKAEVEAMKEEKARHAGWGPAAGGLLGLLLLGGGVVVIRRWRTPHAASLLALAGMGALIFGTAPASAQTVSVKNGATVSMQNGGVFDLGSNSTLVEDASSGARLTGGTGVVTATRTLDGPSDNDVAGLGAVLSSSQNLGETVVTRGHTVQTDNNNESIARYYDVHPGQNNSGLDATLQFTYADAELNGLSESSLVLFRSGDGGSTYTTAGYDGRNASANTVTLSGINSFSRWTLGSESQPLPVELARFDVTATEDGTARLSWKTLSETRNDRFRIERRREAQGSGSVGTWEQLGSVESEADGGTSTNVLRYRFADTDLPFEAQALTYRLVQYDVGGGREVLGKQTLEIGGPQQYKLHGAFPNPVQSSATIRYELPEERPVTISVYDAMGRKVRTLVDDAQQGRRETTLVAKGLASGTYFVRMRAGGVTSTKNVVLVR